MTEASVKDGELSIYVERMMRFIQLLKIYELVLGLPREEDLDDAPHLTMRGTMMGVVYSFFYSLIERDPGEIDFFRIWKTRTPAMLAEIEELEERVEPMRDGLRLFRNRFGFHGSTTRQHEARAFDVLSQFDGRQIYSAMLDMRNLSTKLLKARSSRRVGSA